METAALWLDPSQMRVLEKASMETVWVMLIAICIMSASFPYPASARG